MTTARPTHKDGYDAALAIAEEFGIDPNELRMFASQHMSETMPDLEEHGSSDISIHLSSLGNNEPELLREEAERLRDRNELVKQISARTGRSEEQTLANLRALMAPNEP
jgi:hypothetical protein